MEFYDHNPIETLVNAENYLYRIYDRNKALTSDAAMERSELMTAVHICSMARNLVRAENDFNRAVKEAVQCT